MASPKSSGKALAAPRPVERLIHVIRDQKVMLDSDLPALYELSTKRLNEAVKRNAARFPSHFMFQLTREEADALRSQFATSNNQARGGRRYLPYAFTEHGVVMLSAVWNSPRAIEVSIFVVNAFIRMRELIASNKYIAAWRNWSAGMTARCPSSKCWWRTSTA